ncbi:MAG: ArnT family glycosyltransferase [Oscillochloridaceae bacterium umkhey_bin13]
MGLADLSPSEALPRQRAIRLVERPARERLTATLLILVLSLLAGAMAYQVPPEGRVAVGWLGDRLFLGATAGLGADAIERGDFFADDLTPGSPTGRSRWTRQHARLTLPNLGAGAGLELALTVQGWPRDVLAAPVDQPRVSVQADGVLIGTFTPTPEWASYVLRIPATVRTNADLVIDLEVDHTFTDTASFGADPRPKGVRLAEVQVRTSDERPAVFYPPAWRAVALLAACALLLALVLQRLRAATAAIFSTTASLVGLAAIGLAVTRIWMGAALSLALLGLFGLLILVWQRELLALLRGLVRRYANGRALGYGLIATALVLLGYALAGLWGWLGRAGLPLFWNTFPDSLLIGLTGAGLLTLILVLGREGLPRLTDTVVAGLGSRRGATIALTSFALIWLGYQAWVIFRMPYVGHADYADNAVVARNLVAGRGWVVDYVTQFYELIEGTTRPQETWPLLQPVWIAPFFAVFGPTNWAAKLPNLIFNLALLLLVYQIGSQIWDRRVGLTAAIFTLTNYLFFRLTIYVTSDLAFVVFSVGAIYALYRFNERQLTLRSPYLWLAGLLTGLMMLQKPSGAMLAVGMGLWFLAQRAPRTRQAWLAALHPRRALTLLAPIALWTVIALVVLSPYLVRNLLLFGKPVYSTESHDAWVLGYRGAGGEAWEDIYLVFTPELGGPGVPDRSWILRWGFDKTFDKFGVQLRALRDYLMPVWQGLPESAAWLFGANERKNIVSDLGAWLALIGMIGALRFRRRLISLLALTYAPYMIFMLTYWRTDEERYWVMLIPWLALLAAWTIWAGYDRLASIGDRRWAPLGLILAATAIILVVGFSRPDIGRKVRDEPTIWQPDLIAYDWLEANTTPGAVMMTRIPWQLHWHTERPSVMIPNTGDRDLLLTIARHYDAQYLVLENQQRVKGEAGRLLAPLMDHSNQVGQVIDGFELIYASPTDDFRAFIYRIPEGP